MLDTTSPEYAGLFGMAPTAIASLTSLVFLCVCDDPRSRHAPEFQRATGCVTAMAMKHVASQETFVIFRGGCWSKPMVPFGHHPF